MTKKYTVNTTPTFEREYKRLKKRFPKIDDDYEEVLNEIEHDGILGDPIPGVTTAGNVVFKKRMRNRSARKGLSGGFRVIEYLLTKENKVYLLDIYSKADLDTIPNQKIRDSITKNRL